MRGFLHHALTFVHLCMFYIAAVQVCSRVHSTFEFQLWHYSQNSFGRILSLLSIFRQISNSNFSLSTTVSAHSSASAVSMLCCHFCQVKLWRHKGVKIWTTYQTEYGLRVNDCTHTNRTVIRSKYNFCLRSILANGIFDVCETKILQRTFKKWAHF